jgi:two-component system response regulator FlrC
VRELENIVTRSAFMTKGKRIHDLCFDEIKEPQSGGYSPFLGTIEEMEQMMIMQSLRMFNGNRVKAAQALGISVRKLRYKLNEYRQVQALSFCDETNEADI